MIEPLHIATVGGQQLRFFRTPLDDGRADLPWVAIDDLGRCRSGNGLRRKLVNATPTQFVGVGPRCSHHQGGPIFLNRDERCNDMTPRRKQGRPRRDYSDDPDLAVAEWATALQAAWDLSQRKAIDLALTICQGITVPPSKVPRGARFEHQRLEELFFQSFRTKAGLLGGYKLPMEQGYKSRSEDIRRKIKLGKLRPDFEATWEITRHLHVLRYVQSLRLAQRKHTTGRG